MLTELGLPEKTNSYYDASKRYILPKNSIFVFGSNLSGIHGAGAAKIALIDYGAVYGIGKGLQGKSYAIPTKDKRILTLPLNQIEVYVKEFVEFTQTSGLTFFVTAVGTGLANYKHEDIAPMFKGVTNSWLPNRWEAFLHKKEE